MSSPALAIGINPDLAPLVLIPARGGSKGVPGKNLRPVGQAMHCLVEAVRHQGQSDIEFKMSVASAHDHGLGKPLHV